MKKGVIALGLVLGLFLFGHLMTIGKEVAIAHSQTICPVMDMKINRSVSVDIEGKRVYLCCEDCEEKFKADPAGYIKDLESQGVVLERYTTQ
jgi:YHS domain-containing protein